MAPEMIELAEIVNASPELLEAMKNPAVKKILRGEKTRKVHPDRELAARKAVPLGGFGELGVEAG